MEPVQAPVPIAVRCSGRCGWEGPLAEAVAGEHWRECPAGRGFAVVARGGWYFAVNRPFDGLQGLAALLRPEPAACDHSPHAHRFLPTER